ncbi:MAG: hypothetical protein ABEJ72_05805 [Candidatus Aenigmatarchaeota archaeon]
MREKFDGASLPELMMAGEAAVRNAESEVRGGTVKDNDDLEKEDYEASLIDWGDQTYFLEREFDTQSEVYRVKVVDEEGVLLEYRNTPTDEEFYRREGAPFSPEESENVGEFVERVWSGLRQEEDKEGIETVEELEESYSAAGSYGRADE